MTILVAALTLLLLLVPAGQVQGQGTGPPLSAAGEQSLQFGELLGGLPRTVSSGDPANAAQFRIRAHRRTAQVAFVLPTQLIGSNGGALPLSFGGMDALYSPTGRVGDGVTFDPRAPFMISDAPSGWSWIYLGGTVIPPANAPLGAYTATILLVLADLGS
jgi:hypothetical protein